MLLALLFASAVPAFAEAPDHEEIAPRRAVELDLEIDPIAYALGGYSVHGGVGAGRWRVDLGAYAMDLPELVHGNEGYGAGFHGYGAKLDRFFRADRSGAFVGVGGGWSTVQVTTPDGEVIQDGRAGFGARVGWRIDLPAGFYATPWVGVERAFFVDPIDGFDESGWTVFPTVHLGYRSR